MNDKWRRYKIPIKIILYQILAVFIIWAGILFFFADLHGSGRIIFYVVSSWLLFLIVLLVKGLLKGEFKNSDPIERNKEK